MTRAAKLIAAFESLHGPLAEASPAPVLTDAGDAAIKEVDTFAKDVLRQLNPALKWEWAGRQPSEQQRKSDNLEWTLSVNTQSHGEELVQATREWADGELATAVEDTYGAGDLSVHASVEDNTFPADEDDPEGEGIRFVSVTLRLADMLSGGLLAPAAED